MVSNGSLTVFDYSTWECKSWRMDMGLSCLVMVCPEMGYTPQWSLIDGEYDGLLDHCFFWYLIFRQTLTRDWRIDHDRSIDVNKHPQKHSSACVPMELLFSQFDVYKTTNATSFGGRSTLLVLSPVLSEMRYPPPKNQISGVVFNPEAVRKHGRVVS